MDSTHSVNRVSIHRAVIDGGVSVITSSGSLTPREKRRSENTPGWKRDSGGKTSKRSIEASFESHTRPAPGGET